VCAVLPIKVRKNGTDGRTNRRTPYRCTTLKAIDRASVIICMYAAMLLAQCPDYYFIYLFIYLFCARNLVKNTSDLTHRAQAICVET